MPGGESTTMLKSLERGGFFEALANFVARPNRPLEPVQERSCSRRTWPDSTQKSPSALDITVERNAYGRQNESAILSSETCLP